VNFRQAIVQLARARCAARALGQKLFLVSDHLEARIGQPAWVMGTSVLRIACSKNRSTCGCRVLARASARHQPFR
jgi:hypothetical protein